MESRSFCGASCSSVMFLKGTIDRNKNLNPGVLLQFDKPFEEFPGDTAATVETKYGNLYFQFLTDKPADQTWAGVFSLWSHLASTKTSDWLKPLPSSYLQREITPEGIGLFILVKIKPVNLVYEKNFELLREKFSPEKILYESPPYWSRVHYERDYASMHLFVVDLEK